MTKKIAATIKDPAILAQRRGEIIDIATRLFLENGFHKTSIRDIARACPFNLASLYMYVASKEDILFLVAQHVMDAKANAMAEVEIDDSDPIASFRKAFKAYCRIVQNYRPHIRLLYRELDVLAPARREIVMESLSTVTGVFERILINGIEQRVFNSTINAKLVALDALFLCHLWSLHARALRAIATDVDQFFDMQCSLILDGLLSRKEARKNVLPRKRRAPSAVGVARS